VGQVPASAFGLGQDPVIERLHARLLLLLLLLLLRQPVLDGVPRLDADAFGKQQLGKLWPEKHAAGSRSQFFHKNIGQDISELILFVVCRDRCAQYSATSSPCVASNQDQRAKGARSGSLFRCLARCDSRGIVGRSACGIEEVGETLEDWIPIAVSTRPTHPSLSLSLSLPLILLLTLSLPHPILGYYVAEDAPEMQDLGVGQREQLMSLSDGAL